MPLVPWVARTFMDAGTFNYCCIVDDAFGMMGTVVAQQTPGARSRQYIFSQASYDRGESVTGACRTTSERRIKGFHLFGGRIFGCRTNLM